MDLDKEDDIDNGSAAKSVKAQVEDIVDGALGSLSSVVYTGNDVHVSSLQVDSIAEDQKIKKQAIKGALKEIKGEPAKNETQKATFPMVTPIAPAPTPNNATMSQQVPPASQQIFNNATSLKKEQPKGSDGIIQILGNKTKVETTLIKNPVPATPTNSTAATQMSPPNRKLLQLADSDDIFGAEEAED